MTSLTIGLVGNPNCGKTTVFNALTGSQQKVANWAGVTVEKKVGEFTQGDSLVTVVDLPGTYSLVTVSAEHSLDERIACDYILSQEADVFINIVDASNLERNLYLTQQLLEMQVPVIIALNMMDVARHRHLQIDVKQLQKQIGCPVVAIEANRGKGIEQLRQAICQTDRHQAQDYLSLSLPSALAQATQQLQQAIRDTMPEYANQAACLSLRLLEDDQYAWSLMTKDIQHYVKTLQATLAERLSEDADILIADARYGRVHQISQCSTLKTSKTGKGFTAILDKLFLNRVLGIPIFLGVMYLMFLFAINIGGAFQDFFDIGTNTIFVEGVAHLLMYLHAPAWVIAIVASGAGKGINTVVTFLPVIGGMFLFLSFLEGSGYMARAAFVMDRFMRAMGLPGKSFVPLIVGFGCNVPAIMATRTLDNRRDRVLTTMMSPFMSCSARLAIFAVFTAAFFPVGGQNVVFALYMIGILMAVFTGLILRKTVLQGEPTPFIMELPPYHMPTLRALLMQTWSRLKRFLIRAGRLIVPVCILIGALNALTLSGTINMGDANQHSLLSAFGRLLTPIFAPMGLHADNWPATVGLITGTLAKEVVVATLNTLYTQVGHLGQASGGDFSFWGGLYNAVMTIPHNLMELPSALGNPILASAPDHSVNAGVYGEMYQRFNGQAGAFAYLLFVLLYVPCVSTAAVMLRELNRRWTIFSVVWSFALAYGVAVVFYQAATFYQHPNSSLAWLIGIVGVFLATVFVMRHYARGQEAYVSISTSSLASQGSA